MNAFLAHVPKIENSTCVLGQDKNNAVKKCTLLKGKL